jgi:predicted DCC family thiol-disulfide oxidoreductase YuxK
MILLLVGGSRYVKQDLCQPDEILNPSEARLRIISRGAGTRGKRMSDGQFKLLYDGQCPFCRREVEWLKRRDRAGRLVMEDISDPNFHAEAYGLTQTEVMGVLHGILPNGRIVRRIEATREAYRAVGLGWMVAPLSWPIIGWLADRAYGVFAGNRVALGRLGRPHRKVGTPCSLAGQQDCTRQHPRQERVPWAEAALTDLTDVSGPVALSRSRPGWSCLYR